MESDLGVQLAGRLAAVLPNMPARLREELARHYEEAPGSKAQAVSPEPVGVWRSAERPNPENAESSALENCQVAYGQPCILSVDEIRQLMASGTIDATSQADDVNFATQPEPSCSPPTISGSWPPAGSSWACPRRHGTGCLP